MELFALQHCALSFYCTQCQHTYTRADCHCAMLRVYLTKRRWMHHLLGMMLKALLPYNRWISFSFFFVRLPLISFLRGYICRHYHNWRCRHLLLLLLFLLFCSSSRSFYFSFSNLIVRAFYPSILLAF